MKQDITLLCSYLILLCSCSSKNQNTVNNNTQTGKMDTILISPLYPDTVYFSVEAVLKKQTIVTGAVKGYHNNTTQTHEIYFQRFVEKEGRFRVIHCVGHGLKTTSESGKETSVINAFNDTIKFDELGIFEGEPGDPVDLIPLYPGQRVKQGEYWKPEAKIKIPMGTGTAKYSFVIDSVYKDESGAVLAKIIVDFNADLQPLKYFEGGKVGAAGGGWLIWDCSINQRRETHLLATYSATKENNTVKQIVRVDDNLKVNQGKKQF